MSASTRHTMPTGMRIRRIGLAACVLLMLAATAAQAQTRVTRDGECEVTIVVPIEVWGARATPELIDDWKKNIEATWNGPSHEMAQTIADSLGVPLSAAYHEQINQKYQEYLEAVGGDPSCALINCCKICIKVDIKLRSADASPTPGYHQIEAAHSVEGEWSTLGSVPLVGDYVGEFKTKKVRSHVKNVWHWSSLSYERSGQSDVTSGRWTSTHSEEAHEVGHLMGLPDQYEDVLNEAGEVLYSKPHEGHETDLMFENRGWPQEAAFAEILKIAGIPPIDCCKDPAPTVEGVDQAFISSLDLLGSCDANLLRDNLAGLRTLRASITGGNIPFAAKFRLFNSGRISALDGQIGRVEKRLADCDKPPPTETGLTVTSGIDGGRWCTYGDGIGLPIIAIPTNPNGVPIFPGGPVISGPLGGPSTTPGTAPPVTPGTAPPTTPGQTTTPGGTPSKPPPIRTSGPPSYYPGYSYPPPRYRPPPRKPPAPPTAGPPPSTPVAGPPSTPPTSSKPPEPGTPPPVTSKPPETPPITIFVKATQSVLEGQPQGAAMPGFNTALFPPSKPDLPFTTGQSQTAKLDIGFDKDPVKCTTGQGGECKLEFDLGTQLEWGIPLRGGTGLDRGWNHYRLDYSVPQTSGGVVETTGMKVIPDPKQGLPNNVTVSDDAFKIGNRSFLRLGFDQPYGLTFDPARHFDKMFGGLTYLTDYCRDKQPGPPLGAQPASFALINHALPEATVQLRLSILDQLRARP